MYSNIIGTQQIVITAGFLGLMLVVLIILRKKSAMIRASMKAGRRVNVVEDTVVSPTERLRLIMVDSQEFIMMSSKGHPPSLVCLEKAEASNDPQIISRFDAAVHTDEAMTKVEDTIQKDPATNSFGKNQNFLPASQAVEPPIDEQQQAFAEKFKRWRRQNDAR